MSYFIFWKNRGNQGNQSNTRSRNHRKRLAEDNRRNVLKTAADHDAHYRWLGAGRWGVENANHLDEVPEKVATIVVGQPEIEGATGGPNRIMALV